MPDTEIKFIVEDDKVVRLQACGIAGTAMRFEFANHVREILQNNGSIILIGRTATVVKEALDDYINSLSDKILAETEKE